MRQNLAPRGAFFQNWKLRHTYALRAKANRDQRAFTVKDVTKKHTVVATSLRGHTVFKATANQLSQNWFFSAENLTISPYIDSRLERTQSEKSAHFSTFLDWSRAHNMLVKFQLKYTVGLKNASFFIAARPCLNSVRTLKCKVSILIIQEKW